MSLLACQPLYQTNALKKGLICGGISSLDYLQPTSSIFKFDFETESIVDTTRHLSTQKGFLSSVGFSSTVYSSGGESYDLPYSSVDKYLINTDTSSVLNKSLSIERTYGSSASNLSLGLFIAGKLGKPLGVIEELSSIDESIIPSNHLSRARVGHTSTSNSYEALVVGYLDDIESYTFSTKTIFNKFSTNISLVGQSSASGTDVAVFSGGKYDFPVSFQFKLRYADDVALPVSHLSLARIGGASLSNTAIVHTFLGTEYLNVDSFNLFDSTTHSSFNLSIKRYFSGYSSTCHGGTVL